MLRTREGALLLAGLRVVADRFDSLASATVCHLLTDPQESTPAWLDERIEEVRRGKAAEPPDAMEGGDGADAADGRRRPPWDGHPLLAKLRTIDHRGLSPTAAIVEVIEALHLGRHQRRWGDPSRRAAHVDALLRFADQYETQAEDAGEAATLSGCIQYIEDLADAARDMRRPPPDADAVSVLTYHGAKGSEFPIVVLFDLDSGPRADLWGITVTGGGAADAPMRDRTLRYWPWPFGRNEYNGALLTGTGVEITAQRSEEGQAALRVASEEALRLLYVGFTRARDRLVLAHREGKCDWLGRLPQLEHLLPTDQDAASETSTVCGYDYLVRRLAGATTPARIDRNPADWFAPDGTAQRTRRPSRGAPQWHSPSRQSPSDAKHQIRVERTGGAAFFPAATTDEQFRQIGDGVHAYLAALPSLAACDHAMRARCAERCLATHGCLEWLSPQWLVNAGEAFRQWIARRWPSGTWTCEFPFTAPRAAGGDWHGRADLIIWLNDRTAVLIDHKSTPMRPEQCESQAVSHSGQIAATIEALTQLGLQVDSAWIHFPLARRAAGVSPQFPVRSQNGRRL